MIKAASRFPKRFNTPRGQRRLKCNVQANYQCGGKCQPLKNKCSKDALGMAKDGLAYLKAVEERKARIAAVNAKRGGRSQYVVDDLGNVGRGAPGREADPNKRFYKGALNGGDEAARGINVRTPEAPQYEVFLAGILKQASSTTSNKSLSFNLFSQDGNKEYYFPENFIVNGNEYSFSFGQRKTKGRGMSSHRETWIHGKGGSEKVATGSPTKSHLLKGLRLIYEREYNIAPSSKLSISKLDKVMSNPTSPKKDTPKAVDDETAIASPMAKEITSKASRIEASKLKRGDVVKFARWGVSDNGIMNLNEITVKVISSKDGRVRARFENAANKSIFSLVDGVKGYFYPVDSNPNLAHQITRAQKAISELPGLEKDLKIAQDKLKQIEIKDYRYGTKEFRDQKEKIDPIQRDIQNLSSAIYTAKRQIEKTNTDLKSYISMLPTQNFSEPRSVIKSYSQRLAKMRQLSRQYRG